MKKKWIFLFTILILSFFVIGAGCGTQIKSMDSSEYCGFNIDSITVEEIKNNGFEGELEFWEPEPIEELELKSGTVYRNENKNIYVQETPSSCNLWYKFKSNDLTYRIRIIQEKNRQLTPEREFRQDCLVTNEFGEASCELILLSASFNVYFIKNNLSVIVLAFPPWGSNISERSDLGTIKENVKRMARIVESKI
ncbi:MAG: hypothetical protein QXP53_02705 [Candidatus Pacearchaeota archaeon]